MQFRDRYDIVNPLGRGTTASVYFVRDKHLNVHWAAKIFDTARFEASDWLCMEHEIELLKQIRSLQMPRIVDLYRESERTCVVMDYMEGIRLDRYVHRYGPVGETLTIQWMIELCDIIEQLHQMLPTVAYCDLKPENIILQKTGHIALVDLGSARRIEELHDQILPLTGTRGYSAPELLSKEGKTHGVLQTDSPCLSVAADIYSIGAVGLFLLGGMPQLSLELLEGQISKPLFLVLQRCLAPFAQRISSCNDLKEQLLKI